jgi:hypothetical protein
MPLLDEFGNPIPPRETKLRHRKGRKKKVAFWSIVSLAASILGALGVVALRSQLNVQPDELLAINQPFSAPFEITNTGYFGLHVDYVTVLYPRVEITAPRNNIVFV